MKEKILSQLNHQNNNKIIKKNLWNLLPLFNFLFFSAFFVWFKNFVLLFILYASCISSYFESRKLIPFWNIQKINYIEKSLKLILFWNPESSYHTLIQKVINWTLIIMKGGMFLQLICWEEKFKFAVKI